MEVIISSDVFKSKNGTLKIEKYQDKTQSKPFYRYFINELLINDLLLTKPNKKKIIENFL